jgi:aryl-alcohol dehydrogenase-like predicted oxidoreductase
MFAGASRLGFGCASLGSRIGAVDGKRALVDAFDQGITWYDLAPSYGGGGAEVIFGDFAKGRRDRLFICTKCGIEAPPTSMGARLIRPLARAIVTAAPGMRQLLSRAQTPPHRIPLTGALVRSSLERSLRRLRTDHVNVLALHEPTPEETDDEEVIRALEDAVATGKTHAVGVAGSAKTAAHVLTNGLKGNIVFNHVQVPAEDFAQIEPLLTSQTKLPLCVTHSVFARHLPNTRSHNNPLEDALRQNVRGVVLTSMFDAKHRLENIALIAKHKFCPSLD